MPKYQGESASPQEPGGESDVDNTANEVSNAADAFCPHCGGHLGGDDKKPTPPHYQLSKFSPQDRGFGQLGMSAQGAAGDILTAARRSAASE